jgi:diguanylate cyclase (GGDEF)-like protein/PAS domain S-box-containing protein
MEQDDLLQELDPQRFAGCVLSVEPNLLYIFDLLNKQFVYINDEINATLGYTRAELQDMGDALFSHLVHPEDLAHVMEHLDACRRARQGDVLEVEFRLRHAFGAWHWISARNTVYRSGRDGHADQILGIAIDITEQRAARDRLWYVSTHDALTSLYNRSMFETEVDRLEKSRRYPVTVLLLDIDGFHKVNQELGYAAGDDRLRALADLLKDAFRAEDIVARLGADEFGVLLPNTSAISSEAVQTRIRNRLDRYNQQNPDSSLTVSLSIKSVDQGGSLRDAVMTAEKRLIEVKAKK